MATKRKVLKRRLKFLTSPIVEYVKKDRSRVRTSYTDFLNRLDIEENTILYEAYHGKSITGNAYAIFKKISEDAEFNHFKHVWVINDTENKIMTTLKNTSKNVEFVSVDSKGYLKYLATAKYLINDTSFPYYFVKRKEQIYINTWHGTPLKTLGIDIKQRSFAGHKNIQRNLLHTDYLVSPNEFTYKKLLKSHDIYEIFSGVVADIGYPRVDLTLEQDSMQVKESLGIEKHKKVVLYAPTWRGTVGKEEDTTVSLLDEVKMVQDTLGESYHVLLKSHYFTYQYFVKNGLENLCVPDDFDSNMLLAAVDILITDYSSIFFELLPLQKSVIFYMHDFDQYDSERGFYIPTDELPGPVAYTRQELLSLVKQHENLKEKYQNNYNAFTDKYCYNDDGQATQRLIDIVFKGKSSDKLIRTESPKEKLLFYGGGFYNNGITVSLTNLFDYIDYDKYEVILIDNDNAHRDKWRNMEKLNKNVHILFRPGAFNRTIKETYWHELVMRRGAHTEFVRKNIQVSAYQREFKRVIGNTNIDVAIDFGGYNKFWTLIFAFADVKKKCIFLHNDMMEEYNKKIDGKYKHKHNLKVIFSLYQYFDKIVSVAKSTNDQNKVSLKDYVKDVEKKMVYVDNVIHSDRINQQKNEKEIIERNGLEYLILKDNQETNNELLDIYGVLKPDHKNVNFINVGRLSPEKGQKELLHAFAKVNKKYANTRLYIVGEGPLRKDLMLLIKELQLEHVVILTGQLSNPFVLLNNCDCFVLSSQYEGQGLVLMEAMVVGKPVIGTDVTGVRSVLEGGYGKLVKYDIDNIAFGLEEFILEGIESRRFDYDLYNNQALELFYKEVTLNS
ncbi:glycosyltransferase [Shouchella lehensis]|uniref:glycosyltransferase n=1 Tax=Shouchella lehensis TaxID=300825 RepID=UPI0014196FD4|nr:glycosyltransferase [Shouchella lehensis]MBG9783667.1 hypothetical protein [Shouchella lehensis]